MHDKITSLTNSKIKEIVKLRESAQRKKEQTIVIEGYREIDRAIDAEINFKEFYVCRYLVKSLAQKETLKKITALNKPIYETTSEVYEKISYGDRHDGLLALAQPKYCSFFDLPKKQDLFLLIIEQVEKPGNLGAILRTCDGVGVDGVIVCDIKTDLYNPNVIRSSLGTVFTTKTIVSSVQPTLDFLKSKAMKIIASSPDADLIYTQADFKGPVALIVGSEQEGLTRFVLSKANVKVKIPMRGSADSLNVSTSTAILLYEALRQRSS